jgi:integrase
MASARAIIESVPHRADRDQLFGSHHVRGFSNWDRSKQLLDQKLNIAPWGLHDLRRSVATRLADFGTAPWVIEQLLNHQSGHKAGVHGIYNRSTYTEEITHALGMWEDHIHSLVEGSERKVIALATK